MEVRCSNCSTEYEFDDALVSARGTSVKCTNCGHQFRVHAANAGAAQEKWVVRDSLNRETTFTSLRDLQQAIVKGELNPQHQLSHAGKPFRPLEDIYELSTFFNAARQRPLNRPAPRTLLGVGRDGQSVLTPGGSKPGLAASSAGDASVVTELPASAGLRSGAGSSPGASATRAPVPPSSPPRRRDAVPERITPVAGLPAVNAATPGEASVHSNQSRPRSELGSRPGFTRPSSPAPAKVMERAHAAAPADLPWQQLQGLHNDPDLDRPLRGSGAGSRWIIAVVMLGALALIAGTVGREYFVGFIRPEPAPVKLDERVPALLEQARVALAKGDFENAHAELAKASVLAEADPRVTAALAGLELSRAELAWLQLRLAETLEAARTAAREDAPRRRKKSEAELASEAATAEKQATEKRQLEQAFADRIAKAKAAVAKAVQRAPSALDVVRAQVDALRLEGQLEPARALVSGLSAQASDPDNAFSLGALDLAEGESGYASAIERLRVAARAEEALGKARPLLIYALVQSGDAAAASAELDKLETLAPRHRALPALRGLVELGKGSSPPAAKAKPASVKERAAPAPRKRASRPAPPPRRSAADELQASLGRASTAHREGDLSGAESIYQDIIKRSPNNIPALTGLGDIARQRGSNATAAVYYDRVIALDRNHMPSVVGRADLHWHAGHREQAVALYRRALAQVGPSDPYGRRALRRIEEFDKAAASEEGSEGAGSEGAVSEGAVSEGEGEQTSESASGEAEAPEPGEAEEEGEAFEPGSPTPEAPLQDEGAGSADEPVDEVTDEP